MHKICSFFLLCVVTTGCVHDDDLLQKQLYALSVSQETDNADIMLLANDGSYIICDLDNGSGYGIVYYNPNVKNDFEDGLTVYVNSDGFPEMASFDGKKMFFKRGLDGKFDIAFVDEEGNEHYAFDVVLPEDFFLYYINTKSWFDPWSSAWHSIIQGGWPGSWDEYQYKALVPFLCKVASFGITAASVFTDGPFGIVSLVITAGEEITKSKYGYDADWLEYANSYQIASLGINTIDLKSGKVAFSAKEIGLNSLALILNNYADEQLKELGKIKESVEEPFNEKEWRITLSENEVFFDPDGGDYSIRVTSKAAWTIDESSLDKNWCSIHIQDNNIYIHADPYEKGIQERVCSVCIKSSAGRDDIVKPVTLKIRQYGTLFDLTSEELVFTQSEGSIAIGIVYNDRVSKWEVAAHPKWCKCKKYKSGLEVSVKEDKSLLESIEGLIYITAYIKNGSPITKTLLVRREIDYPWNGTEWHFKCISISDSGNLGYSGILNDFTIAIQDVETGSFDSNMQWWSSMELLEDGNIKFNYHYSFHQSESIEGITLSISAEEKGHMIVSRTSDTSCRGTFTVSGTYMVNGEKSSSVFSGICDGSLSKNTRSNNRTSFINGFSLWPLSITNISCPQTNDLLTIDESLL